MNKLFYQLAETFFWCAVLAINIARDCVGAVKHLMGIKSPEHPPLINMGSCGGLTRSSYSDKGEDEDG